MAKNWEYAASIVWPFLVEAARDKRNPIYKELAELIHTNPLSVRNALDLIQNYCMDSSIPPLTFIVVNKNTGLPGAGFIAWEKNDIESAFKEVYEYSWESVPNPFLGLSEDETIESLSDEIIKRPRSAESIYAKVKSRGLAQKIFRITLLKAYDGKCAICGFSIVEALEAAHIIPWSIATPEYRISPENGLLLCSNHHKLFDKNIIQITTYYKVLHNKSDVGYGDVDRAATVMLNCKALFLPSHQNLYPSRILIDRRNDIYNRK